MRLVKNISMTASSSALAQGVAAIATPALTRLNSPDQYATWAIFAERVNTFETLLFMKPRISL
jgi:O-antigen/teichoic acid export membrane protein